MDTARYIIALLTVIPLPGAIIYWLIGHPLADFWRRVGPGITYSVLFLVFGSSCWLIWYLREPIFAVEYGTNWWLIGLAVPLYLSAMAIQLGIRKQLTFRTLIGMPEFVPDRVEGKLLEEGIYGRVRHPRYLAVILGVIAAALFANYLAGYVTIVITIIGLHVIVRLEEPELRERFGDAYELYRERVPMLIPRMGRKVDQASPT